MAVELCSAVYDRILPGDKQPTHIICTYIVGHNARHSWETLRVQDELEAEELHRSVARAMESEEVPTNVRTIVQQLASGKLDSWLELILAAGHDRKRAKRGVLGFPRHR